MIEKLVSTILTFLLSLVMEPIYSFLDTMLALFSQAGALRDLLSHSWVNNLILGSQAIAAAILIPRVAVEALKLATLRAEGAPVSEKQLFMRIVQSVVGITAGPWVVRQAIIVGNTFANGIAGAGIGGRGVSDILQAGGQMAAASLVLIFGIFLIVIIFIQALIRTVEITLAAIISPFAALGYMSGGGMADSWIREVIIIAMSHAVQMLLTYMALSFLFTPTQLGLIGNAFLPTLYFIATLWVALRTPKILRNYAYQTGVSEGASMVGQAAIYRMIRR